MKLALGTVQFGLDYGISNKSGRTPEDEARAIIALASEAGVNVIDTAPAYGTSESVLGKILPADSRRVVTKTSHYPGNEISADDIRALETSFASSLTKLGRESIYGLLLHGAGDLLKPGGKRLFAAMENLRSEGRVKKIGVSAYTGKEIDAVNAQFAIDLIQLPLNALDQRLIGGGQLKRLKDKGVEIHSRSAFLQGLLLMNEASWPVCFASYISLLQRFQGIAAELGLTPLQAALAFVSSVPEVDHVVCGVNSLAQWQELIAAAEIRVDTQKFGAVRCDDAELVDPTRWKLTA